MATRQSRPTRRPCLGCQKEFQPPSRYNRFCVSCQQEIRAEPGSVPVHLSKRELVDVPLSAVFG